MDPSSLPADRHRAPSRGQRSLYWRAWRDVCRAHDWHGEPERLGDWRQSCWRSPELDKVYQAIFQIAARLVFPPHNKPSLDALRHACHAVATGRLVSSRRLGNANMDRVLALFRLLAAPESLDNITAWLDEESGERRRLVYVIRQTPAAYGQAIARDKFHGETDVERLSLDQRRQLALTLRKRAQARAAKLQTASATPTA